MRTSGPTSGRTSGRSTPRRGALAALAAAAAAVLLAGCTSEPARGAGDAPTPTGPRADVLHVLAGSELRDVEPVLAGVAERTGVRVELTYTGTLEGTQLVADGGAAGYDATWFPSNDHLALLDGGRAAVARSEDVMSSPVALGVAHATAVELGWVDRSPTWAEVVDAADDGRLRYGMTSPVSSNSGFATLVGAATALSGTGTVLAEQDVAAVAPQLRRLARGHELTAGSTGFLVERFTADPRGVNALFGYESVLRPLRAGGEPLDVLTPSDGTLTAEYPLTLLRSAGEEQGRAYDAVVADLLSEPVQRELAATGRRTTAQGPAAAADVYELPFPNRLSTVRALLSAYQSEIKKPSDVVFAVDTSGSMDGERLTQLQGALAALTVPDGDAGGAPGDGLLAFQARENVRYVEFADTVKSRGTFAVDPADRAGSLARIREWTASLRAEGGTAIHDSLRVAYEEALSVLESDPERFVSVTLFTDGENTDGGTLADFRAWHGRQAAAGRPVASVPTFVIVFGEADPAEMAELAALTGGETFAAGGAADLAGVFEEIRGYQ
ncbi:VWA domain-containing protein [Kineococcus auxinigenes]|uniref:VWA domain-containing protein n=1 Tax=unclassified Kineococcus TaxID=2621656 RepID=UPI003D7C7585